MEDDTERRVYETHRTEYLHRITMKVDTVKKTMVPLVVDEQQSIGKGSKCCGYHLTTLYEHLHDDRNVDAWFKVPDFCH